MARPDYKIPTSFHLWCGIATTIKYLPREIAKHLPRGIAKRHPTGVISPGPQITQNLPIRQLNTNDYQLTTIQIPPEGPQPAKNQILATND